MSKEDNKFPVLHHYSTPKKDREPKFVKWSELSEAQARENHGQSLSTLASRGGLSPCEMVGNVKSIGWCDLSKISELEIKETMAKLAV